MGLSVLVVLAAVALIIVPLRHEVLAALTGRSRRAPTTPAPSSRFANFSYRSRRTPAGDSSLTSFRNDASSDGGPMHAWLTGLAKRALLLGSLLLLAMLVWLLVSRPVDFLIGASIWWLFVHAPAAFALVVATGVLLVAVVNVLLYDSSSWCGIGRAAARAGLAGAVLASASGAMWAHAMWGAYWVWDPVTQSAIVALLAFFFLRWLFVSTRKLALLLGMSVLIAANFWAVYGPSLWNALHAEPFGTLRPSSEFYASSFFVPLLMGYAGATLVTLGIAFVETPRDRAPFRPWPS